MKRARIYAIGALPDKPITSRRIESLDVRADRAQRIVHRIARINRIAIRWVILPAFALIAILAALRSWGLA